MKQQIFYEFENLELCLNVMFRNSENPMVILFPGLNLSKSGPFFLLSLIARKCFNKGFNTIQFDYYGEGDSKGDYCDIDLVKMLQSVAAVKHYCRSLGITRFIYIGYGIGNIISSMFICDKDVIACCMIAPKWTAHEEIEKIVEIAKSHKNEYMYGENCIWPVIHSTVEENYWLSIIGIVPGLYYTPIKIKLLQEISTINFKENLKNMGLPLLILGNEELHLETNNNNIDDTNFIINSELRYRTMSEWKKYDNWPLLWEWISDNICEWLSRIENKIKWNVIEIPRGKIEGEERRYSIHVTEAEHRSIMGVLDVPDAKKYKGKKLPLVIYEAGLGGSRVDMSRVGPWLGEVLSNEGFYVFRYDSIGSGVSDGEFYEVTWDTRISNLKTVIDYLKSFSRIDIDNIYLISYSAGAKVVCLAANCLSAIKGIVMWSPHFVEAVGNKPQFQILSNGELVSPLSALWLGYKFFLCEKDLNFIEEFNKINVPVFVINGTMEEEDLSILPINNIIAESSSGKFVKHYPGAHCFLYKYMNSIIDDTVQFLKELQERV